MSSPAGTGKRLLLTPGEPAGIGPDITLLAAAIPLQTGIIAIADPGLLEQRAGLLGLDISCRVIEQLDEARSIHQPGSLDVLPVELAAACTAGQLTQQNSSYVLECLRLAAAHCISADANAMVTGPVHKGIINDAGYAFTGHTEFLANLYGSRPVMMLATETLRVALATTHLPLKNVSNAITRESLVYIMTTLHDFLKNRCRIELPRIIVCGLNPHAGENGHLGTEELEIITPSIRQCIEQGMDITGPLPADTAFTSHYLKYADAVLAMYHDQGLPVLKHSGFGKAVNITLGLPFTRTSVDHGTALELAGSGRASETSLLAAINMAASFC